MRTGRPNSPTLTLLLATFLAAAGAPGTSHANAGCHYMAPQTCCGSGGTGFVILDTGRSTDRERTSPSTYNHDISHARCGNDLKLTLGSEAKWCTYTVTTPTDCVQSDPPTQCTSGAEDGLYIQSCTPGAGDGPDQITFAIEYQAPVLNGGQIYLGIVNESTHQSMFSRWTQVSETDPTTVACLNVGPIDVSAEVTNMFIQVTVTDQTYSTWPTAVIPGETENYKLAHSWASHSFALTDYDTGTLIETCHP